MKPTLIQGALIAALSLLVAPACSTHHPGVFHHGDYTEYARGHDRAYERGYHHGVQAGVKDWRRNRRFDPWHHGRHLSGDSGYNSRYGPRPYYYRAYREGFRAGYERGYGPHRR